MNPKATRKLTYGLFLLTANADGKDNGCIINTAVQVANEPTRISISVINTNYTCDQIKKTGIFNLSSLDTSAPFALYQRFGMQSGREMDKFDGFGDLARSENGLYYLTKGANAFLSCKVVSSQDLGSHTLFIGELVDAEILGDVDSVTYAFYQSDIKPRPQAKPAAKKQWVCSVCGYVYEGDEVPDDFECPLCHHGKEDFTLVNG